MHSAEFDAISEEILQNVFRCTLLPRSSCIMRSIFFIVVPNIIIERQIANMYHLKILAISLNTDNPYSIVIVQPILVMYSLHCNPAKSITTNRVVNRPVEHVFTACSECFCFEQLTSSTR